jgi:hypothetical protein
MKKPIAFASITAVLLLVAGCGSSQQDVSQTTVHSANVSSTCARVETPHPALMLDRSADAKGTSLALPDLNKDGAPDVAVTSKAHCNAFGSCIYAVYTQGACPEFLGNVLASSMTSLASSSHGHTDLLVNQSMTFGEFQLKYAFDGKKYAPMSTRACWFDATNAECAQCGEWIDVKADSDLLWPATKHYAEKCDRSRKDAHQGR